MSPLSVNATSSVELRWFFERAPIDDLGAWLGRAVACELPAAESSAAIELHHESDAYLVPFDTDDLGIKLRDGRLERKERTGHRPLSIGPVEGELEYWTKITSAPPTELEPTIVVTKVRALLTVQVHDDGLRIAPAPTSGASCQIELARLFVDDEEAGFTFGLEARAMPTESDAANAISWIVERIGPALTDECGLALDRRSSCGYPAYLRAITLR